MECRRLNGVVRMKSSDGVLSQKIMLFTDLHVWKEGHTLVLMVYRITNEFPNREMFGLVSQMRRSSLSITSNIAEGFGRRSYREKVQFYTTARGSLTELENQLLVSKDVGYLSSSDYQQITIQATSVHKLINGLIRSSKTHIPNSNS